MATSDSQSMINQLKSCFIRRFFSHRSILSAFCRSLMAALCFHQLRSITESYISGDTISKVDLSFPDYLTLPSVTLCLNFLDTLNTTRISFTHPEIISLFHKKGYDGDYVTRRIHLADLYALLGSLNLTSLKEYMRDNMDSLLAEVTPAQLEFDDGLEVICNTTRYLIEPRFCHTITCYHVETGEPAMFDRNTIFEPRYGGRMLTIELDSWVGNITQSLTIYFTSPSTLLDGSRHSSYSIDLTHPPTTFTVTYTMIRNDLGSVSAETNCLPSESMIEGQSAVHADLMFSACVNKMCRTTIGCSFFGTVQSLDEPAQAHLKPGYHQYFREFLTTNLTQREVDRVQFMAMRKSCARLATRPNCVDEIYTPVGDSFSKRDKRDYTIIIEAPTAPFEYNEFFLEIALLDYLIYICSSLSFWFGISIISIVDRLLSAVFKSVESRNQTIKTNQNNHIHQGQQDNQQNFLRNGQQSTEPLVPLTKSTQSRVLSKFNTLNKPIITFVDQSCAKL